MFYLSWFSLSLSLSGLAPSRNTLKVFAQRPLLLASVIKSLDAIVTKIPAVLRRQLLHFASR